MAALALSACTPPVAAWDAAGTKAMKLHARDGSAVRIGSVHFESLAGGRHRFELKMDGERFADWNGVYFKLRATEQGLVGTPQAIDLNRIDAPPASTEVPPYRPALRDDIAPDARWFVRLTIE